MFNQINLSCQESIDKFGFCDDRTTLVSFSNDITIDCEYFQAVRGSLYNPYINDGFGYSGLKLLPDGSVFRYKHKFVDYYWIPNQAFFASRDTVRLILNTINNKVCSYTDLVPAILDFSKIGVATTLSTEFLEINLKKFIRENIPELCGINNINSVSCNNEFYDDISAISPEISIFKFFKEISDKTVVVGDDLERWSNTFPGFLISNFVSKSKNVDYFYSNDFNYVNRNQEHVEFRKLIMPTAMIDIGQHYISNPFEGYIGYVVDDIENPFDGWVFDYRTPINVAICYFALLCGVQTCNFVVKSDRNDPVFKFIPALTQAYKLKNKQFNLIQSLS